MLILIGKTASGKDAIRNELKTKYGFTKAVGYTTRPIREGEIDGDTYYFISNEEFEEKKNAGFFSEWKEYETVQGKWCYGTSEESLLNADLNTVVILTPAGYRDVKEKLPSTAKVAYIYANNATITERLMKRGDDDKEAQRRLESDNADFRGIEFQVDKIFYNNQKNNLAEVVDNLVAWYVKD